MLEQEGEGEGVEMGRNRSLTTEEGDGDSRGPFQEIVTVTHTGHGPAVLQADSSW